MRQTKYMRIALSIILTLCVFVQFVCAQTVLILPYNASGLMEEQKAMNPDRLAYPTELKETIKNEVSFECNMEIVGLGPFSVSATKQVIFSPGNLQFNAMQGTHQCADGTTQQGTWRFAEHQWDYVGDATKGNVYEGETKCDNAKINATYNGWIDLFGWGTSGWSGGVNAYKPYETSQRNKDYYPGGQSNTDLTGTYAKADWGVYNQIGEDPAGTWRTLTKDEWYYLVRGRKEAEKLFGLGTVNDVPGMILLPDDWITPEGVTFTPSTDKGLNWSSTYSFFINNNEDNYSHNVYTSAQWDKMESGGAVFLPAAGDRLNGTKVNDVLEFGNYWSTTHYSSYSPYLFTFYKGSFSPQAYSAREDGRTFGHSVRLVSDVK